MLLQPHMERNKMSPDQLKQLRELSERFQEGDANHEHIKKLSDILSLVNNMQSRNANDKD